MTVSGTPVGHQASRVPDPSRSLDPFGKISLR